MGRKNDLCINTILPQDLQARIEASIKKAFCKHGAGSFFSPKIEEVADFESTIPNHLIQCN